MNASTDGAEQIAFIVSLHVRPECVEEFLRLLTPVLNAMRHEASFVSAVLHQDREDPTRFMIYETWTDLNDVAQIQVKREYRREYEARLPELLREPRRVQFWRPLRGDFTFLSPRGATPA